MVIITVIASLYTVYTVYEYLYYYCITDINIEVINIPFQLCKQERNYKQLKFTYIKCCIRWFEEASCAGGSCVRDGGVGGAAGLDGCELGDGYSSCARVTVGRVGNVALSLISSALL